MDSSSPPSHAIISGGSSGIGLALASRLAAAGWSLSLLARDPVRLDTAKARLIEAGARQVGTWSVDVADPEALGDAVQQAMALHGPPALVVACAGMVIPGRFEELPLPAFRRTMDVNYLGALHLVRAVTPTLRQAKAGRIVLVSSGAGLIGLYGYTAYAPSKFAVRGLAEALRSELAPDGIAVSVVYPPDTDTPQLREEQPHRPAATARIAAGARVLSADDVAASILRGIGKRRFTIAPGFEMSALARLHSLVGPLLHRFWFDRLIRDCHKKAPAVHPDAGRRR